MRAFVVGALGSLLAGCLIGPSPSAIRVNTAASFPG